MNARKSGLSSNELVIAELGERLEDFETLREGIRSSFKPADTIEEKLCEDAAINWWRRQRVRLCEATEIRKATRGADLLAAVDRVRETSILKERFLRLVRELARAKSPLQMSLGDVRRPTEIEIDLDAVRGELRRSSTGLAFLMETLDAVAAEADAKGELSDGSVVVLSACLGASDECGHSAIQVNANIKKRAADKGAQGAAPEGSSDQSSTKDTQTEAGKANTALPLDAEKLKEVDRATLVLLIGYAQLGLRAERNILSASEGAANDVRVRAGAVLVSSRLDRAEASYDRRWSKAISTLYSIRFQQAQMELARESLRQSSQRAQSRRLRRSTPD
jgi:hypothetical protein